MAQNRAAKSGLAHEAQQKINAKWSPENAQQAIKWIGERINEPTMSTDGSMDDVYTQLKDGLVLCKLANWVKPGSVPANKLTKAPTMAFKQMELIGIFLDVMGKNGIDKTELFQTVDLYEKVNMTQVITCIDAVGRRMLTDGREGYGKKIAEKNVREFTEEQLKAGQNVIGLQMGSNKGASQAGQNFGKSRMIVDWAIFCVRSSIFT